MCIRDREWIVPKKEKRALQKVSYRWLAGGDEELTEIRADKVGELPAPRCLEVVAIGRACEDAALRATRQYSREYGEVIRCTYLRMQEVPGQPLHASNALFQFHASGQEVMQSEVLAQNARKRDRIVPMPPQFRQELRERQQREQTAAAAAADKGKTSGYDVWVLELEQACRRASEEQTALSEVVTTCTYLGQAYEDGGKTMYRKHPSDWIAPEGQWRSQQLVWLSWDVGGISEVVAHRADHIRERQTVPMF